MGVKKPLDEDFRKVYGKLARIKNQVQAILIATNEISNQLLEITQILQALSTDINLLVDSTKSEKSSKTKERKK